MLVSQDEAVRAVCRRDDRPDDPLAVFEIAGKDRAPDGFVRVWNFEELGKADLGDFRIPGKGDSKILQVILAGLFGQPVLRLDIRWY